MLFNAQLQLATILSCIELENFATVTALVPNFAISGCHVLAMTKQPPSEILPTEKPEKIDQKTRSKKIPSSLIKPSFSFALSENFRKLELAESFHS